jgi:tetratricopeptide (TPR) repeat protein
MGRHAGSFLTGVKSQAPRPQTGHTPSRYVAIKNNKPMKRILTFILIFICLTSFGQRMSFSDWKEEAKTNKRLLPKYGYLKKTDEEKKADEEFIKYILKTDSTFRKGSDHLVQLGFKYMYRGDIKTAMYRMNQAWLLDSLNSNVFWGFGAIYGYFSQYDLQKDQYDEGLKLDSMNSNIYTDFATLYLSKFYDSSNKYNLFLAIELLRKSYLIEPKNQVTLFKLSICYMNLNECSFAWKYYDECKKLGGEPITDAYTKDLKKYCKKPNEIADYSNFRKGTFHQNDKETGLTIIERTEQFQIEENLKFGYKIKLKIEWIDECIFKLNLIEDLSPIKQDMPKMNLFCIITEIDKNEFFQVISTDISPIEIKLKAKKIK